MQKEAARKCQEAVEKWPECIPAPWAPRSGDKLGRIGQPLLLVGRILFINRRATSLDTASKTASTITTRSNTAEVVFADRVSESGEAGKIRLGRRRSPWVKSARQEDPVELSFPVKSSAAGHQGCLQCAVVALDHPDEFDRGKSLNNMIIAELS